MIPLVLLAAAAAQPAETPRAFMTRIYARYRLHPNVSSLKAPRTYYASRLASAIAEDARLARGEVGYLDGDPVCQCQDTEGLRAKILWVHQQGPRQATIQVLLDYPDSTARRVRFSLVHTPAGWRIADVLGGDEPSLLRALEDSNHKARRKH
jgi:hypothetical protein